MIKAHFKIYIYIYLSCDWGHISLSNILFWSDVRMQIMRCHITLGLPAIISDYFNLLVKKKGVFQYISTTWNSKSVNQGYVQAINILMNKKFWDTYNNNLTNVYYE